MTASYLDRTPVHALPLKRPMLLALMMVGAQLFGANEVAAQQVCGDTTCAKGFLCETVTGGACPAIDCADPNDCPPLPCEPREYHMCVPAACTEDSDCGPEQVCAERVVHDCAPTATPACPPGAECEKTDLVAPECTSSTVSFCTLRWQLPCTVAADCGAGFDCVPQESCGTSGSPGTGAGTPGSAPESDPSPADREERAALPTPPDTTCTPTGTSACVPIVAACQVDGDCLSGWTCQANPSGVCWSGPDGEGCAPADPAKLCVPPYYGTRGGSPEGVPTYGDGGEEPTSPGATPMPEAPKGAPGAAPPSGENDDAAEDLAGADGGCSVSAAAPVATAWAWLALGLAGALRFRRRR